MINVLIDILWHPMKLMPGDEYKELMRDILEKFKFDDSIDKTVKLLIFEKNISLNIIESFE